ncbi:MAG: hypothetical protein ACFFCZ_02085 [Promethearchaeota archaeon]
MTEKLQRIKKIRRILKDRRGSPLVEQLIIIAVGFLILLILLGFVTGVFDWIFEVGDDAISIFKDLLPVF